MLPGYKIFHFSVVCKCFNQVSSRGILRQCTHQDFKEQVLPAVQKAMLRNPEIILGSKQGFLKVCDRSLNNSLYYYSRH